MHIYRKYTHVWWLFTIQYMHYVVGGWMSQMQAWVLWRIYVAIEYNVPVSIPYNAGTLVFVRESWLDCSERRLLLFCTVCYATMAIRRSSTDSRPIGCAWLCKLIHWSNYLVSAALPVYSQTWPWWVQTVGLLWRSHHCMLTLRNKFSVSVLEGVSDISMIYNQ